MIDNSINACTGGASAVFQEVHSKLLVGGSVVERYNYLRGTAPRPNVFVSVFFFGGGGCHSSTSILKRKQKTVNMGGLGTRLGLSLNTQNY